MQIYVCIKQVPDTAASITLRGPREFDEALKFVMNPFDEFAVEQALRVKEQTGAGEVVVVTVGRESAESVVRTALAMGADRGILVTADIRLLDSLATGRALYRAIAQDGSPDLIFTGKQSVDSEGMQIPYRLAAAFDMPIVNEVVSFLLANKTVSVEREIGSGMREVIDLALPCIIGATKGLNEPRYTRLPEIMKARSKELKKIDINQLGVAPAAGRLELMELFPEPERGRAMMLQGSVPEMILELTRLLTNKEQIL
ncbi:MAG: electron transfer flavoprotein subunit beta/FixA family protein [Thermodesulfobacteriota bacterium]